MTLYTKTLGAVVVSYMFGETSRASLIPSAVGFGVRLGALAIPWVRSLYALRVASSHSGN